MRNICLVAVLLALPFSADAQQRRGDERRSGDRQAERQAERRESAEERHAQRRDNGQRQAEQRSSTTTALPTIGLQPQTQSRLPWWEQNRTPAWEQHRTPAWEQRQVPTWEQQRTNPSRAAQQLNQELARSQRLDGRARSRPHYTQPPVVYVLPPYRYFDLGTTYSYGVSSSTTYVTSAPPNVVTYAPPPLPEIGVLRLEVEPRHVLQVFVDGLFVGTLADLGNEIELRLGARRIELRAPGYRTLIFDTEIVPDRMVVYRGELERVPEASAPRAPEAPRASAPQAPEAPQAQQAPRSRTMYLIPGCYMGNVQPTTAMLRSGCDLGKLVTMTPP